MFTLWSSPRVLRMCCVFAPCKHGMEGLCQRLLCLRRHMLNSSGLGGTDF